MNLPRVTIIILLLFGPTAPADETIDFAKQVRPLFQKYCYTCHAEEKQKSGLRLVIKSEAFKGGELYGPSIIAHDAKHSPLVDFMANDDADLKMPPDGESPSAAEILLITKWVEQGAVWPDGIDLVQLEDRRDHWAFKPIADPDFPAVTETTWPRNEIDMFILAKLEQNNLKPSPEVVPNLWLRRVYLDLVGLPPSLEQFEAFQQSSQPLEIRVQQTVNELLDSPRYGERWAQHWLDVVRYADTHGFEVNTERPHAWPYRDYVIDAFNNDTPYNRFIEEQLCGDRLQQDAATGFMVTAAALLPGQIGKDDASKRLARQDELDEILINTGEAFLGLSIGCARCHDHKFDPISHKDYYAFQALFSGVRYGDRPIRSPEANARRQETEELKRRLKVIESQIASLEPTRTNATENHIKFEPIDAKFVRFNILDANLHPTLGLIEPCVDEFEIFAVDEPDHNLALASAGVKVVASGSRISDLHRLEHINDGKYGNESSWMSDENGRGWVQFELPQARKIHHIVWGRDRNGKFNDRLATALTLEVGESVDTMRIVAEIKPEKSESDALKSLRETKKSLEIEIKSRSEADLVFAGRFETPAATRLLIRGDPEQPSDVVLPAVLSSINLVSLADGHPASKGETQSLADDTPDEKRRKHLADWIASPENPLTARVIVNRIWQGHFGIGLVETASDFGRSGSRPSHPELLDWLAREFIRSGWSIKHLHRLIVTSATYRQSNRISAEAQAMDADNRLLWRFPTRRMEAEAIRDSILFVSGRLNYQTGGRGFDLFRSRGGLSGFPPIESFDDNGRRRMIYSHKIRMEREIVFGAFDCPDAGQTTASRRQSTTPIQALNLFNSRFTFDEANAFAERIVAEVGEDRCEQVHHALRLAFGREADADELSDAKTILEQHGLMTLCRVIFNSNEFLFWP